MRHVNHPDYRQRGPYFDIDKARDHHCYICRGYLKWTEFHRDCTRTSGLSSNCRECENYRVRRNHHRVRANTYARNGGDNYVVVTTEQVAQIRELYRSGESIKKISEATAFSKYKITRVLIAAGVVLRGRGRPKGWRKKRA